MKAIKPVASLIALAKMCCTSCTSSVLHCRFIHLQHAYWRRTASHLKSQTWAIHSCFGVTKLECASCDFLQHECLLINCHKISSIINKATLDQSPTLQHCLITAIIHCPQNWLYHNLLFISLQTAASRARRAWFIWQFWVMLTTSCWGDLLIWKSLEILFNRPVHKSYCQSLTVKQSRAIFRCRASPACPSGMSTNTVRTALNCTAGKSKHNKVLQMRCMYKIVSIYDHLNLCVQYLWTFQCLVLNLVVCTRSTAQGGGGSFKNPPTPLWRWRRAYWGATATLNAQWHLLI